MAEWTPTEFRDLDDVDFAGTADGDAHRLDAGANKLVPFAPATAADLAALDAAAVKDGDAAGGDLDGTYPNPDIRDGVVSPAKIDASGATGPNQVILTDGIGGADWDDPPFVPGPASAISIVDAAGDFTATNVEDALAELQSDAEADAAALASHLADPTDAHDASAVSFVPTGTVAATDVQAAIAEVASEAGAGGAAVQANLDAHIADTTDAHDASAISILDAANDFAATNVETALAELQSDHEADAAALAAHIADTGDAHDASAISILDAAGDFTATDVEGALAELQSDHEADAAALATEVSDRAAAVAAEAATRAAADTALDAAKADKTVTLTAGDGLSGGGTLAADRSFAVNVDGVTVELSADALRVKDGGITDNKLNSEAAPVGTIATADGLGGVSYEPPAAASAGASGTFFWEFDDATATPPATGSFRLDDTPQEDALNVYFHETDDDGVVRTLWLSLLGKGDRIVISEEDDPTAYITYEVTDPPVDSGAYWTVPVEVFVNGGALGDTARCGVTFLLGAGGGSGETILKEIEQTAHGLDVGDWIRLDSSGDYVLAQADSAANAEALGIVIEADTNVFVFALFGWISADDFPGVLSGLTPGATYFLSDTVAGAMEIAPGPEDPDTVSKPVLTAASATSGWVRELRGMVNADPTAATPFTRETRTSNTKLVVADHGKTITYTTGGFTQTIDDAAVLGNGWWVVLHNTTLAPVTLDPDGGDTIDGAVTRVLHVGESIMVLCDGSNFFQFQITEAYPWTTIRKAVDETVNNSTAVQDDNELTFATVAGGIYEIEAAIIYASPVGAGTPDIKFDFGEDGTLRGSVFVLGVSTAEAASSGAVLVNSTATHAVGTAAANRLALFKATYLANGSPFRVRWAENTLNANDLIVRAGSVLRYRRYI